MEVTMTKKKEVSKFDKKVFQESVEDNLRSLFRKKLKDANKQEIFQAVSYAVKDVIIDDWMATTQQLEKDDPKILYYMSMEFLMGRALGNSLINLKAYKEGSGHRCCGRSGERSGSWQRRSWKTCRMFPGFSGNTWLPGIRLRYPLPFRYVQAEDRERLSDRSAG